MVIVVRAVSGPAAGTRFVLETGRIYEVGRDARLPCAVPADTTLAPAHFSLQSLGTACRISDLDSSSGTLLNGRPVTDAVARAGDQITAGRSVFAVSVERTGVASDAEPEPAREETAPEFCARMELKLSDAAGELLSEELLPLEYFQALLAAELDQDALRFLTHWLPKKAAVRWAAQCVHEVAANHLSEPELSTLESARNWAEEPTEQLRRVAEAWAQYVGNKSAAGMIARAAFWSEGSLSPPDVAVVPPADNLTGKALFGGLMIAAAAGSKPPVPERVQTFLQSAIEQFGLKPSADE